MKQLKNWILGWILYHANRFNFGSGFSHMHELKNQLYSIKNQILKKATHLHYDLQVIPEKECYSCGGTGEFTKFNGKYEICWNCYGSGWFKDGFVVVLDRVKLGGYSFHQPKLRTDFKSHFMRDELIKGYQAMYETDNYIEGYISKKPTALSILCLYFLFRMNGKREEFWKNLFIGWRGCYWQPEDFVRNIFYLRKYRKLPVKKDLLYIFHHLKYKIKNYLKAKFPKLFRQKSMHQKRQEYIMQELSEENDLPF